MRFNLRSYADITLNFEQLGANISSLSGNPSLLFIDVGNRYRLFKIISNLLIKKDFIAKGIKEFTRFTPFNCKGREANIKEFANGYNSLSKLN